MIKYTILKKIFELPTGDDNNQTQIGGFGGFMNNREDKDDSPGG